MRLTSCALAALLLAVAASAQVTYYVDPVSGSDTFPGTTRGAAFGSITFASGVLADDDRLILMPGTYSPTVTGEQFPIGFGQTGSQRRVQIIAEEGPATTILDGENQSIDAGTPLMRFYLGAEGASLQGLQFINTGSASYWSMAIRIGSTSGANYATKDVEVTGCVFRNVHRAIVIFGSNNTTTNPNDATTGCRIHDNLAEGTTHRAFDIWGDGTNFVTNNTCVNCAYEGVVTDSLGTSSGQGGANAVVTNNIVVGSQNIGGIAIGTNYLPNHSVFDSNIAFNNPPGDFVGGAFPGSNISVDPMFVGGADYHLLPGSPAIQTGSMAPFAQMRVDLDNFPRAHDSNGDGLAIADRGAYQYTQYGMATSGTWLPGGTVNFTFSAPSSGGAVILFAYDDGAVLLQPFGILAVSPTAIMAGVLVGGSPGSTSLNIPNDPALSGGRLLTQGVHVGSSGDLHLLNAYDHTL
jgi:hypothetical protein